MRRRGLISTIAFAGFANLAQGQNRARIPVVVVLDFGATPERFLRPFRKRLSELGYIDGRDIRISVHEAQGKAEQLSDLAQRLVTSEADVIVAPGVQAAKAALAVTAVVPIVMMHAADPVGAGLVASLSRPGGNVTGTSSLTPEIVGKLVELVRELSPSAKRAAVLLNRTNPSTARWLKNTEYAGQRLGLDTLPVAADTERDLDAAFSTIESSDANGLVVLADPFLGVHRAKIVSFARARHLIDVYAITQFARDGGLAAYSPAFEDHWIRGAEFVVKLLNGAKPANLPVEEPTRFQLVVNLKTAHALGINVSHSILARADEVIE